MRAMDCGPGRRPFEFHPLRRSILIGTLIAVMSQLYLNVFLSDFRISASVALLPVLLMTVGIQLPTLPICLWSSGIVFLFRLLLLLLERRGLEAAVLQLVPGALYYIFYGLLFQLQIRNRNIASTPRVTVAAFFSDFGANMAEILLRISLLHAQKPDLQAFESLFLIALARTAMVLGLLLLDRQYRELQVRNEQERRYQRLFLITTGLKNELYLMHKNSDEIERVMRNAYRLSEIMQQAGSEELGRMAFDIARDVHEIKKDYFRIIQGVEETVNSEYDEDHMHFRDLMEILEATLHGVLREKELNIRLIFDCRDDFMTGRHYALMMILKNLASNAIEAIEGIRRSGTIFVMEWKEGESYIFRVADDGPGIVRKNWEKIFRLGYSSKFDEKTGNIYRGVGLAGVKNIVEERLSGVISVESTPGHGAAFTVKIPAAVLELTDTERQSYEERVKLRAARRTEKGEED